MTEQNAEPSEPEQPEPSLMPRWVPLLIGVVLVTLAGLAVYTGLRYRDDDTILEHVRPQKTRASAPAPTGEPGAGSSLMFPDNTPIANAPVSGTARTEIRGGPGGIRTAERLWARRGVVFNVLPDDTLIYINDLPIGQVRQFNSVNEVYDFAEPGSYNVKLVAPKGAERMFVVTAADDAQQEIARISLKLE